MPVVRLYHNPRCSKSRETLALLRGQGVEPELVLYLEQPPSVAELEALADALGLEPPDFMRIKEPLFAELGLSRGDTRSRREWLELLARHPSLLERPICLVDGRARLGRPPQAVLELFDAPGSAPA
ncbi:MAG: arsenate reductase (glutaredoxin) [Candidatus Delongbacteria bacterium]